MDGRVHPKGRILVTLCLTCTDPLDSLGSQGKWLPADIRGANAPTGDQVTIPSILEQSGFEFEEEEDMPFLIRAEDHKFQWGCTHAVVWRKRAS